MNSSEHSVPTAPETPAPLYLRWLEPGTAALSRRLLAYVRPHRRVIGWSIVATVLHAGADAVLPFLLTQVVERLEDAGRTAAGAWQIPLLIVVVFPFRGAMDFLAVYGLNLAGRAIVRRWREELFDHYLNLPAAFHDKSQSGHLISKLTYNTDVVGHAIAGSIVVVCRDSLSIVFLLGVMLYFSWQLTLIVVVVGPMLGFLVRLMTRAFRRYSARIQSSMGDVTRVTEQSLLGHRIIKVFGGQRYEQAQFDAANRTNFRLNTRIVAIGAVGNSLTQLVVAGGIAFVIYAAFSNTVMTGLDAPEFVGFLTAMGLVFAPLKRLTSVNVEIQRGVAAAESVFEILDEPAEDDTGTLRLDRARGRIELRGASFAYESRGTPALENVDLDVTAGSSVALVGHSGSGKSTLLNLLPRFYPVSAGSILLDGTDIRRYRLADLRRQFSLVSQDTVLFDDTIANNIAYGAMRGAPRADVERAADAAFVTEFAAALPGGLDAPVGERGNLLSGGQRQRIAIARAVLKDAPILLLDEPTSALDTESERRIQTALDGLMKNRTTLIVAHRLSTVERADVIVVLENGRIVETGTHAELLARDGHYSAVYRMQFESQSS